MDDVEMGNGFNLWMDEFIKNPESFRKMEQVTREFLNEKNAGRMPTYGERCVEMLKRYAAQAG